MWLTRQTGHLNSVGTDDLGDKAVTRDGGNEAGGSEDDRVTHLDYVVEWLFGEKRVLGSGNCKKPPGRYVQERV